MGKSGHDVISSSSLISYSLFHLALTCQLTVLSKFRRKVLSNNSLLNTHSNHNASDWWEKRN